MAEYEAYMRGFANPSNYKELKKYYKKQFFEDFIYVKNNHPINYVELFYKYLSPSFVISPKVTFVRRNTKFRF